MDFTDERDKELMNAYRKCLAETNGGYAMHNIAKQVAASPCSRFWVSEERATIVMYKMLSNQELSSMRYNKKRMFEEIFSRFKTLRDMHPEKSVFELTSAVVHQHADSFYLTTRTVSELIYRINRKMRNRAKAKR